MKQLNLINTLFDSLKRNKSNNAFCISGINYSYDQLLHEISICQDTLKEISSNLIGIVDNDDIHTYAAIFAVWSQGKAILPLNPSYPSRYNDKIVKEAAITSFFDSLGLQEFDKAQKILITNNSTKEIRSPSVQISSDNLAYLLFTSGSTGEPKGVPITYGNLELFINSHELAGIELNAEDRCLQMFDLTFDLSFGSFILPLLKGACIYTIPKNEIKYTYILKLLKEERLTITLMVPSVLSFLNKITRTEDCESLRYSLFCGESLELDAALEWSEIALNAHIFNVYGPTEATIYCTVYKLEKDKYFSNENGILSIGTSMKGTRLILINENGNKPDSEESGEICLGGNQVIKNYWGNKHQNSFFEFEGEMFYKTGDIGKYKQDGLLYYLGRIDSQVKIQGYRVELQDIEYKIKRLLNGENAIVFSYQLPFGGLSLGVVIESALFESKDLVHLMNLELPNHMIPTRIEFCEDFQLNKNGKLDRKAILSQLEL